MAIFRLPACPATGSPAVSYQASVEGPGIVAVQRRTGRGRWADVTDGELRNLLAAPTDLAVWLREQLDQAGRPRHRPRKALDGARRQTKSLRLHPDTIATLIAEAEEYGESQGEVVDRWARERS